MEAVMDKPRNGHCKPKVPPRKSNIVCDKCHTAVQIIKGELICGGCPRPYPNLTWTVR